MPRIRNQQNHDQTPSSYRFPSEEARRRTPPSDLPAEMQGSAEDVLSALESVSRRIDDLARELNCLGHFQNDDDDRPRAA
jgi:hypothetical protein